jgi:hypothetical protein
MLEVMKYFRGSPLWLISLFVLFAEGISTIAAIQIQEGWAQGALVIFVISYATMVTLIFFLFLWKKPENFYSPSDYVETKPAEFIAALRALPVPDSIRESIASASENPFNKVKFFELLNNLLKESVKQHLVLMAKSSGEIQVPENQDSFGRKLLYFEFLMRDGALCVGQLPIEELFRSFKGTDMISLSENGKNILLQSAGRDFANWLISNKHDAEKMKSDSAGWGQPFDAEAILTEIRSKKETENA